MRPAHIALQWETPGDVHIWMFVEWIFEAGFSEDSSLLLLWKHFRALNFLLFAYQAAISDSMISFVKEIPNLRSEYLMSSNV